MRVAAILAGLFIYVSAFMQPVLAQEGAELLIGTDAQAGEAAFRQCKSCHTVEQGGRNRVGPNLYGVIGRPVASVDGFRYSNPMKNFGGEWSIERLNAYLENPRGVVPGTRMAYRGMPSPTDRANLIAYLNTFSDNPIVVGAGDTEVEETGDNGAAPAEDFGQLFVAEGVEETYYACTACHSEMIVAQQGKTRENWDKLFDWMIEEQGMSELDDETRNIILDYLAAHYNTDRPNFPRPQ